MKALGLFLMSEQRFDFPAQNLVSAAQASFRKEDRWLSCTLQRGVIDLLNSVANVQES